jgi:hypothetical protein
MVASAFEVFKTRIQIRLFVDYSIAASSFEEMNQNLLLLTSS